MPTHQGLVGGDIKFVEFLKYSTNRFKTLIITSNLGKKFIEINGVKSDFIITSKEKEFHNPIPLYLIRIINSFKLFFL